MFDLRLGYRWLAPSALALALMGEIACLPAEAAQPVLKGTGAPLPATFFGMHAHRLGEPTPWPTDYVGALRTWDAKVRWADLQPSPDRWDFGRLDRIVDGARSRNIDVLVPLGMPPAWASARPTEESAYKPGEAAPPKDIGSWRAYVKKVAARYKGKVQTYEIWNEPNLKKFFSGTPEEAAALTCEARQALDEVDASIRLVSPAPTGANGVPWLKQFFAAGGAKCVNIVGFHFYNSHLDPESHLPIYSKLKSEMTLAGVAALPVWNTETGWLIVSNRRAMNPGAVGFRSADRVLSADGISALLPRSLLLHAAMGIERYYWYALDNDMMGLIEADGTPKSGWRSYQETVQLMRGRVVGPCGTGDRKAWVCELHAGKVDGGARVRWLVNAQPDARFNGMSDAVYDVIGRGRVTASEAQDAYKAGMVIVEWANR